MKKQLTKIKIAAENLGRSTKHDRKDMELEIIEKQVDKYRDVLEKMVRKLPAVSSSSDAQEREKRVKKNSHYKIGQALEESSKELSKEMPLHHVLSNCGELEKSIADCIVRSELETETKVVQRLKNILDTEIQEISTLKRNLSRTVQEYASITRSYEAAKRLEEPKFKIDQIKDQQEQCEVKLEKDRDSWAAQMFELIAKEDVIVDCIQDYVLNQRKYHEEALHKVNTSLAAIQDIVQSTVKSRFGTSLAEHLCSSNREISYIIELCVCCLVESGLYEEGLLRVGCASTKLRRMKRALEAQYVKTPLPSDYQDPHVIGSILKLYLRELPEPLLTYKLYKEFISAVERESDAERRTAIKATLGKLPAANYANLRYLTKFLWLVTQNAVYNKMNSQNLAIVMSPNLLWQHVAKSNPDDYLGQVNSSSSVNVIVELLISQWDYFFDGEVDFFATLQRHRLFVEQKSKSNSSNENLDKHDSESVESPRYGTIRRQKACAPSPPAAKIFEKAQNNGGGAGALSGTSHAPEQSAPEASAQQQYHQQQPLKNGEINHRAKELFPINNNNSSNGPTEKPEKPPLPKLLQLQFHELQQPPQSVPHQPQPPPQHTQIPVPMTRTQFFGLDNLPSPVADRKSSDSVSSLTFKPDVPQKPKIPKRPMVLGINVAGYKSDDEMPTPTQQTGGSRDCNGTTNTMGGSGGAAAVTGHIRNTTEKFLDKMRADNCDNVAVGASAAGAAVGATAAAAKGTYANSQDSLCAEQNANVPALPHTNTAGDSDGNTIVSAHAATTAATAASATPLATAGGTTTPVPSDRNSVHESAATRVPSATSGTASTQPTQPMTTATTPTTPISPNMIVTPKRPTVPAPPPPSVVKKQVE